MIRIRSNVFETNSSSVHSIVIDVSQPAVPLDDVFVLSGGEYGWGYDELCLPEERANYIWQAIWDCSIYKLVPGTPDEWRDRIHNWLPNVELKDIVEGYSEENDEYLYPGIDHGGELATLIEQMWYNDEMLGDFLTNKESHVVCSNDNSDSYGFYYPATPYIEFRKGN